MRPGKSASSSKLADQSVWWIKRREELMDIAKGQLNAYVYDRNTVSEAVARLRGLESIDRVLYAMKANFNPDLLRLLASLNVDFECVSPDEVKHLLREVPGLSKKRILFTPNFAPKEDYEWARDFGIQVTLDNLYPLQAWPELFEGQDIFLRMDPGEGRGHHDHVKTAGEHSKFGIPRFELDELVALVKKAGACVKGIHAHSGSGIPDASSWGLVATELARVADRFPDAAVLDLGGGLGVPEKLGGDVFDLRAMDNSLMEIKENFPKYELWLEPGRYLVSAAGILLTHVTQVKGKGDQRYIGVGTGMNSLIRPALYNAYHEIINLSRINDALSETVNIVGLICETGDTFGMGRRMPPTVEGDVIAIANAGAYARVMASQYNLRPTPNEIVI
jgi:diaminopimelate decarboxylase/aspartate kinase